MKPHINLKSVWRGIRAMTRGHGKVNTVIRPIKGIIAISFKTKPWRQRNVRFWFDAWTPVWHEGRGPYITIGLGLFAFYRGY